MTRRKEAYHQKILEDTLVIEEEVAPVEDGIDTIHHANIEVDDELRNAIIYDWYLKNSFVDHISDEHFNGDNFRYCNFKEYGDFSNQPFEVELDKSSVTFSRDGGLYFPQKMPTRLEKSYTSNKSGFDFKINLSTEAEGDFNYILEHNFHFADYEKVFINGELLKDEGSFKEVKTLEIHDAKLKQNIIISLDIPCDIYYFQLKTLSQSEHGFDLTVQGIGFAMVTPFSKALTINGTLEVKSV